MQTVAGPPTNEAPGAAVVILILPERVKHSVPSTRRSSRILTKTVIVLPSLAPRSNVITVRNRVKS